MDTGTVLLDFLNHNGIPGAIIVFGGWFLVARLWPFIVDKWWPDTVERNKRQTNILSELTEAVVELKLITQQMSGLLTEQRQRLSEIQVSIAGSHPDVTVVAKEGNDDQPTKPNPSQGASSTVRTDNQTAAVPAA